jgi:hypothetical protein
MLILSKSRVYKRKESHKQPEYEVILPSSQSAINPLEKHLL